MELRPPSRWLLDRSLADARDHRRWYRRVLELAPPPLRRMVSAPRCDHAVWTRVDLFLPHRARHLTGARVLRTHVARAVLRTLRAGTGPPCLVAAPARRRSHHGHGVVCGQRLFR